jgi:hypothetical protein
MGFDFTPEAVVILAGTILALAFNYIPGADSRWEQLAPVYKRLIMAGLLLLATGGAFGLLCAGIVESTIACDKGGLLQVIYVYILAIMANQSVYSITKRE